MVIFTNPFENGSPSTRDIQVVIKRIGEFAQQIRIVLRIGYRITGNFAQPGMVTL